MKSRKIALPLPPIQMFPCLMQSTDVVILMRYRTEGAITRGTGTVVHTEYPDSPIDSNQLGYHTTQWNLSQLKPYLGKIELDGTASTDDDDDDDDLAVS